MKRQTPTILWSLFILALIAVIAVLLIKSPSETPEEQEGDNVGTTVDAQKPVESFSSTLVDSWAHTKRAESDINKYLDPGQRITSVIEHPEANTAWITSEIYSETDKTIFLSVYEYNETDYTFTRLYKKTYKLGDIKAIPETMLPTFKAVALDKNKLVLLIAGTDDSPGPCTELLLMGQGTGRSLVSLDLENPYSGFTPYEVPKKAVEEAQARAEKCMEETF